MRVKRAVKEEKIDNMKFCEQISNGRKVKVDTEIKMRIFSKKQDNNHGQSNPQEKKRYIYLSNMIKRGLKINIP